jgi:hypothetical protein
MSASRATFSVGKGDFCCFVPNYMACSLLELSHVMKAIVRRVARALTVLMCGWSYDRWDPPYPGDGI